MNINRKLFFKRLGHRMAFQSSASQDVEVVPSSWWIPTGCTSSDVVCAYKAEGAASLAASYSNLNNPGTQDAIATTPPTWDSTNGWKFNGSDQYISTGTMTITENLTVICKFSNRAAGNYMLGADGFWVETTGWYISDLTPNLAVGIDGASGDLGFSDTSAIIGVNKNVAVKNGVSSNLSLSPSPISFEWGFFIGATNRGDETANNFTIIYVQSFILYNKTLTGTQIEEVTTNIQNGY